MKLTDTRAPWVAKLTVRSAEGLIIARVIDVMLGDSSPLIPGSGDIFVHFNFDLEPVGVGTSSHYDAIATHFYESGYIARMPDYDYFEEYKNEMIYRAGGEWVTTPTLDSVSQ